MKDLFCIIEYPGSSMLLGLAAKDAKGCADTIAWQRKGGFDLDDNPIRVCKYDQSACEFVSVETGKRFSPSRAPFTQEAWDTFFDKINSPIK